MGTISHCDFVNKLHFAAENRVVIMKGMIIFVGMVSASLALYVQPEKTNLHNYRVKRLAPAGQRLDCYDRDDCTGARITVRGNSVPNLAAYPYHFDNRIQSCKFNGIYILYDWRYYNHNDLKGKIYGEAWDAHCAPMRGFMNQATSIRLVGSPSDWKDDSITFFEGEFYNGKDQSFFRDASSFSMNDFGRSMIITGCSKWTLYEHSHFNGQSACWQPRDNCAPAFFRDEKLMKGWAQKVSSVRRGCYSDKTFYGEPLLFERAANNSTIGSSGHVFGN